MLSDSKKVASPVKLSVPISRSSEGRDSAQYARVPQSANTPFVAVVGLTTTKEWFLEVPIAVIVVGQNSRHHVVGGETILIEVWITAKVEKCCSRGHPAPFFRPRCIVRDVRSLSAQTWVFYCYLDFNEARNTTYILGL